MYKVAIIGAGQISKYYISAIEKTAYFELHSIFDKNISQTSPTKNKRIIVTKNINDIIDNKEINCVFILLPNYLHYSFCLMLLNSGKHICCEKPLSLNYTEAKSIVSIAQKNNRVIFTAFHRRYNKYIEHADNNISCNVKHVLVEYHDDLSVDRSNRRWYFDKSRAGGGCIIDSGSNALDVIIKLFGEIKITEASIKKEIFKKIESVAIIKGITKRGVPFTIDLNWHLAERKKITIIYKNKTKHEIDFLKGSTEYKGSMFHEYIGVLKDYHYSIKNKFNNDNSQIVKLIDQIYRLSEQEG